MLILTTLPQEEEADTSMKVTPSASTSRASSAARSTTRRKTTRRKTRRRKRKASTRRTSSTKKRKTATGTAKTTTRRKGRKRKTRRRKKKTTKRKRPAAALPRRPGFSATVRFHSVMGLENSHVYTKQGSFRSGKTWKRQGKSENIFQSPESWNIHYSPVVREFENSWLENQNSAHNRLFFEADKKKKATEMMIIG